MDINHCYRKEELRVMYYTGRDEVSAAKVHHFREGVMTKIGDIKLSDWRELVQNLIERNGDHTFFEKLKAEARSVPWIRSEKEAIQRALELYCFEGCSAGETDSSLRSE